MDRGGQGGTERERTSEIMIEGDPRGDSLHHPSPRREGARDGTEVCWMDWAEDGGTPSQQVWDEGAEAPRHRFLSIDPC